MLRPGHKTETAQQELTAHFGKGTSTGPSPADLYFSSLERTFPDPFLHLSEEQRAVLDQQRKQGGPKPVGDPDSAVARAFGVLGGAPTAKLDGTVALETDLAAAHEEAKKQAKRDKQFREENLRSLLFNMTARPQLPEEDEDEAAERESIVAAALGGGDGKQAGTTGPHGSTDELDAGMAGRRESWATHDRRRPSTTSDAGGGQPPAHHQSKRKKKHEVQVPDDEMARIRTLPMHLQGPAIQAAKARLARDAAKDGGVRLRLDAPQLVHTTSMRRARNAAANAFDDGRRLTATTPAGQLFLASFQEDDAVSEASSPARHGGGDRPGDNKSPSGRKSRKHRHAPPSRPRLRRGVRSAAEKIAMIDDRLERDDALVKQRERGLDADTIKQLVDAAYWSDVLETRADTASAFATLSANDHNLQVLAENGALGAILAMLDLDSGGRAKHNTPAIATDALSALANLLTLLDAKRGLHHSPTGVQHLLDLVGHKSNSLRMAALRAMMAYARLDDSKNHLVANGAVFRLTLQISEHPNEPSGRASSRLLRDLSTTRRNMLKMPKVPGFLSWIVKTLCENPDVKQRRDIVQMVINLASVDVNKPPLVGAGILRAIEAHLNIATPMELLHHVTHVLLLVGLHPANHEAVVSSGVLVPFLRSVFDEMHQAPLIVEESDARSRSSGRSRRRRKSSVHPPATPASSISHASRSWQGDESSSAVSGSSRAGSPQHRTRRRSTMQEALTPMPRVALVSTPVRVQEREEVGFRIDNAMKARRSGSSSRVGPPSSPIRARRRSSAARRPSVTSVGGGSFLLHPPVPHTRLSSASGSTAPDSASQEDRVKIIADSSAEGARSTYAATADALAAEEQVAAVAKEAEQRDAKPAPSKEAPPSPTRLKSLAAHADLASQDAALLLQSAARGWKARRVAKSLREARAADVISAVMLLQAVFRRHLRSHSYLKRRLAQVHAQQSARRLNLDDSSPKKNKRGRPDPVERIPAEQRGQRLGPPRDTLSKPLKASAVALLGLKEMQRSAEAQQKAVGLREPASPRRRSPRAKPPAPETATVPRTATFRHTPAQASSANPLGMRSTSNLAPMHRIRRVSVPTIAGMKALQSSPQKSSTDPAVPNQAIGAAASTAFIQDAENMENDMLRMALALLCSLAADRRWRDALVFDLPVLHFVLRRNLSHGSDHALQRSVIKILRYLAECEGHETPRHAAMILHGALPVLTFFLCCRDDALRRDAALTIADMSVSETTRKSICVPRILSALFPMTTDGSSVEVCEAIARILAELADDDDCEVLLAKGGALRPLARLLGSRNSREAKLNAARALSNLSSNKEVQPMIVESGAMSYLIHMSKTGLGLDRVYAAAALENVKYDAAAQRIQNIVRAKIARNRAEAERRARQEAYHERMRQIELQRRERLKALGLYVSDDSEGGDDDSNDGSEATSDVDTTVGDSDTKRRASTATGGAASQKADDIRDAQPSGDA